MIAPPIIRRLLVAIALGCLLIPQDSGATDLPYLDNAGLTRQLKELAGKHRRIARLESLARTVGKNRLWLLELGAGSPEDRRNRPALLVVAGLEAGDLGGTACALHWAELLLGGAEQDAETRRLLGSVTIYVLPRGNPDGAAAFFAKPRAEKANNNRPWDDDRDGLTDEDGPEDLDGDGLVTWMRVQDPEGEFNPDPADTRLMIRADRFKGEHGGWRFLVEGRDNDADEVWNEDGRGGVNLNRNFPFQFRFFAADTGRHPVSEVETRALADFVVGHPNISAVFCFGSTDNLTETPKGEAPKRPPVALHEKDLGWYRELGKQWRDGLGLKKEIPGGGQPGTFGDWMYYHRGRLALAARAWSPALELELAKAIGKTSAKPGDAETGPDRKPAEEGKDAADKGAQPGEKKDESEKRNEEERAYIKWLDTNMPSGFVAWKEFAHPDFPGRKVEIGGFAPYARAFPLRGFPRDLAGKQGKFLSALAGKLPQTGIRSASARSLGSGVYEVTVKVENRGELPTALAQGELSREVRPTRVILSSPEKSILSGQKSVSLEALQPGEVREVRWVVNEPGTPRFRAEVISTIAGTASADIEVKEDK